MLGYFKYFNFLGELFTMAAGGEWLKMNIFLPVGISFLYLPEYKLCDRCLSGTNPTSRPLDRLCFLCIVLSSTGCRANRSCPDFIPQMYKNPTVARSEFGEGLFLILCGLFKENGYLGLYQYEFRGSYF